jgi:uncharacterized protein YeeX (DUF496 family)
MKRYVKNLWLALTGANPYSDELQDAKDKLNKAADNLSAMRNQLYAALEKWEQSVKRTDDYEALIENLRERIKEKDTLMERMKEDYQKRIDQYTKKIDELSKK